MKKYYTERSITIDSSEEEDENFVKELVINENKCDEKEISINKF